MWPQPCFPKAQRLERIPRIHWIWPWLSVIIRGTPRKVPTWEGRIAFSGDVPRCDLSCRGVCWERQVEGAVLSYGERAVGAELLGRVDSSLWSSGRAHPSGKTEWAQDVWREFGRGEKASLLLLLPLEAGDWLIRHFCRSQLSLSPESARIIGFIKV